MININKAREILEGLELKGVKVRILNPTAEMREFLRLSELGMDVELEEGEEPAIILEKSGIRIVYNAVPAQMEYEPFLRTIARLARSNSNLKEENLKKIADCNAEVVVFVAPFCPHCAKVVEIANKIAIANPKIKVRIVDVSLLTKLGERFGITSAPTVVINGEIKLVGELSENELVEWIYRANSEYKFDYFVTLLRDGRIDEVMEIISKKPEDVEVLGEILDQPELMARIGAMILLERVFRDKPEAIEIAKRKIRELLLSDDSVKAQDAAFILGKIGRKEDIPLLQKLLESRDSEVREAAREAINEIEERDKETFLI
ncbi:MAG: hypothetical protein DRO98_00105 [Archaeoglobales archaeon]|nr:MAG: hypothetical protein DRO98_00105 [Archaeoglobales archaeon]